MPKTELFLSYYSQILLKFSVFSNLSEIFILRYDKLYEKTKFNAFFCIYSFANSLYSNPQVPM